MPTLFRRYRDLPISQFFLQNVLALSNRFRLFVDCDVMFSSLVFTARCYWYKLGLCCRPVSVCHVGVYCIQTAEDVVKLLSRPGSPIILVFLTPRADTQL